MDDQFVIEHLDNRNFRQIADFILHIQQVEFNIPITLEDQPDLLDIEAFYGAGGGGFWGVLNNQELVGTIALIAIGHRSAAIRKMFVKKEFRGKQFNIAKALLDGLITYCVDHDISDLYLGTVEVLQAAQKFYERNGFAKINEENLPAYFPKMNLDSIFYHLHIA